MFYWLWIKRVLFSFQSFFHFHILFSLFGLILAVASLSLALLVVNGFSSGIEKTLIDRQGHIRIHSQQFIEKEPFLKEISDYQKFFSDRSLFLSFKGMILNEKDFKGVFFEAIQDEKLKSADFIKNRILKGDLNSFKDFIVVGSDLAKELNLSVGSLVTLIASQSGDFYFSKKQAPFKVSAIVDFGRHEFNSRLILMPLSSAFRLDFHNISGVNLWIKDRQKVDFLLNKLQKDLGDFYFVSSWKDIDRNFLEVIESDKKIIFLVLLILIVTAGFNVSSSLFVQVFRRTRELSLLRALGARRKMIAHLFLFNGLILGAFGSAFGVLLGLLLCYLLVFIQNQWQIIPTEVYKVNEMVWEWKSSDLFLVFIVSLILVVLSSLLPAYRAYKMNITEGLSHV